MNSTCGMDDTAPSHRFEAVAVYTVSDDRSYVFLDELYAHTRRKGMGRQLLGRISERMKQASCKHLVLLVDRANTNALMFYERMGFERGELFESAAWYHSIPTPSVDQTCRVATLDTLQFKCESASTPEPRRTTLCSNVLKAPCVSFCEYMHRDHFCIENIPVYKEMIQSVKSHYGTATSLPYDRSRQTRAAYVVATWVDS